MKEGMPEAEALALMGPPDDVRTEHDAGGVSTTGTKVIWRYGTSGHLTPVTLGQVYIDKGGCVQYVFGKGTPPPEGMFKEQDLRRLLDALGRVPSYSSGWQYDPRKVIRAVNLLQPLGKERALAVIDEYLRVASPWHDDGREGAFLVLRVLFDVPGDAGFMPVMRVGAPSPAGPKDPKLLPRFPIALEGDIPFLIVEGYDLCGEAERPQSHVDYFREQGTLRARPLIPSEHPFGELDAFSRSPRWIMEDRGRGMQLLGGQVLSLMGTVYRREPGVFGEMLPFGDKKEEERIVREASELKVCWDMEAQKYTLLDGTSLPGPEPKHYRRELWRPELPGLDVELILERKGASYVHVETVHYYEVGKPPPTVAFRVFDPKEDQPLVELLSGSMELVTEQSPEGSTAMRSSQKTFELKEGSEIRVELLLDGKAQAGPTFKP